MLLGFPAVFSDQLSFFALLTICEEVLVRLKPICTSSISMAGLPPGARAYGMVSGV